MKKALLGLAALTSITCTQENSIKLPTTKESIIEKKICTQTLPCSDLQRDFLRKIEKMLEENKHGMVFFNTNIGLLFSDNPPNYLLLKQSGEMGQCIAVDEENVMCREITSTYKEILESIEKLLKNKVFDKTA